MLPLEINYSLLKKTSFHKGIAVQEKPVLLVKIGGKYTILTLSTGTDIRSAKTLRFFRQGPFPRQT